MLDIKKEKFMQTNQFIKIIDLPVRCFHILLALSIVSLLVTGFNDMIGIHMVLGYYVGSLLLFRFVWFFFGSPSANIKYYLHPIKIIIKSLSILFSKIPIKETYIGPTPSGGLFIIFFLITLSSQFLFGLFITNFVEEGIFFPFVSFETSLLFSEIHTQWMPFIIIFLIFMHLSVNLYYLLWKKNNLITPMLTGKKNVHKIIHPLPDKGSKAIHIFGIMYITGTSLTFLYYFVNYP